MKPLAADQVVDTLRRGASARLESSKPAAFRVGQHVIVKNKNPSGHIRLPGYVRTSSGTIDADRGAFTLPDLHSKGIKCAERLYCVRFESKELWDVNENTAIYVDLFESYLMPA